LTRQLICIWRVRPKAVTLSDQEHRCDFQRSLRCAELTFKECNQRRLDDPESDGDECQVAVARHFLPMNLRRSHFVRSCFELPLVRSKLCVQFAFSKFVVDEGLQRIFYCEV